MPELPEIETIRLQLNKHLVGQVIERLEQLHPKSVQGDLTLVNWKKITGVERKGKMLIIKLSGGVDIAVHFKMSGQLILVKNTKISVRDGRQKTAKRIVGGHPTADWMNELPSKHTRAIFHIKGGSRLYFNDQRIFGWIKIFPDGDIKKLTFLQKLGQEPWDIPDAVFYKLINRRKKAIKLVVMDQEIISGVGNIYANDALWEAGIHPQIQANKLTQNEAIKLRECIIKVLKEGIRYGGATAVDAKYIDLHGLGGHYQEHFRTYDRENQPCLKCKTPIKKITLGGRGTYFCPRCQVISKHLL